MESETASRGFRLTHVGLRVANLDTSVAFYAGVFGMSELGRMQLESTTIVFLGYPDIANPPRSLFEREGVLELVYSKNSQKTMTNSSYYPNFRFVKLAFAVPDMAKAMEYIKSHNVRVLKEAGSSQGLEVVPTFLGCDAPDKGKDASFWEAAVGIPFLEDPDGYLIEIIPY
ncbi:glyoxalase family protein [Aspergillus germanicus]